MGLSLHLPRGCTLSASHDRPADPGITVERLLAEELLRGSLIAGETGLDRLVTWCIPFQDPKGRGPEEDLSGMAVFVSVQDLVDDGAALVRQLDACGAALILAWSRNGSTEIGLTVAAEAAEARGLPLLRLPPQATFQRTSRLLATKILAQSTHVLEYGTRVHRALGDVFSRGGGLPALAHSMSQLSCCTVLILASNGELLASAAPTVSSERCPDLARRVSERLIDPRRSLVALSDDPARPHSAHVVVLEVDDHPVSVVVCPVLVGGEPYGVLALVEPEHPVQEHDLAQHSVVAEQGVSLAASELLRQQSVREAEERARNDFVHALLHGRFTDQLELSARAEHYRFPLDGQFAVYIVTATGFSPDDKTSRRKAREASRAAQSIMPEDDMLTLTALVGSMLVVVRQVGEGGGAASEVEGGRLAAFGEALRKSMCQRLGDAVRVSYGRPGDGARGAASSYREARTAEALGRRVDTGAVNAYSDLRVFAAIQDAALSTAGQSFAREILAPLQQADGQTGNLEEVVRAYIAESGNLNATARRLHLHRNTMLYKLDRASRALRMDVRTTEAQFMIWLAHHIDALGEVVGALDDELVPPH